MKLNRWIIAALTIGFLVSLSIVVSGGFYEISGSSNGNAHMVNKFTGEVYFCQMDSCFPAEKFNSGEEYRESRW